MASEDPGLTHCGVQTPAFAGHTVHAGFLCLLTPRPTLFPGGETFTVPWARRKRISGLLPEKESPSVYFGDPDSLRSPLVLRDISPEPLENTGRLHSLVDIFASFSLSSKVFSFSVSVSVLFCFCLSSLPCKELTRGFPCTFPSNRIPEGLVSVMHLSHGSIRSVFQVMQWSKFCLRRRCFQQ